VKKGRAAALPAILERVYEKKWAEEVEVGKYPERCGEEPSPHLGTSVFWWGFTGRGVGEGRYFEDVVKKHGLVAGLCELVTPFTTRYHCSQQCPKAIPGRGLLDWQFRGAWLLRTRQSK